MNCSDAFRELLMAVIKEVLFDGAALSERMVLVRKCGRRESVDFDSLEEDLDALLEVIKDYKQNGSNSSRLMINIQSTACGLDVSEIDELIGKMDGGASAETTDSKQESLDFFMRKIEKSFPKPLYLNEAFMESMRKSIRDYIEQRESLKHTGDYTATA